MSKSITSVNNPIVKQAASLHLKKYRDETGTFLIEGAEMIGMALGHHWQAEMLFVLEGQNFKASQDKMIAVSKGVLAKISKKPNPQDVIAVFKKKKPAALPKKVDGVLLVLEEIRDPGNLGTIMRTCHALGLKQLVLIGNCCDPYTPEVIRASMGSFAAVDISLATHQEMIEWKKKTNARWIGTDVVKATDYRQADYADAVLLMGNEQKGLSPALKALTEENVTIPMPGGAESLNVAMATTLLLYEVMRDHL
jgi:RNA methyltransferase, TrmH family